MIPPIENPHLYGHEVVEEKLCQLISQQTLPHAMLITGPQGVGKATLAYRLARFMLLGAEVTPPVMGLFGEEPVSVSLDVAMESPAVQRMIAGSHGDLLVIQPEFDEKKKSSVDSIFVQQVRKVVEFMHRTPSESEWRVVIIDPAEAMNVNAANALLKVLEEPPKQTLLLLVSHQPGRLLPTIRSRCRQIELRPPKGSAVQQIFAQQQLAIPTEEQAVVLELANHSPGLAMQYYEHHAADIYQKFVEVMLAPEIKPVQAFAAEVAKAPVAQWHVTKALIQIALYRVIMTAHNSNTLTPLYEAEAQALRMLSARHSLAYWLDMWEKAEQSLREVTTLMLDKKQVLIQLLFATAAARKAA